MNKLIELVGNVAGVVGILLCLVAGVARITGNFYVLNYEAQSLFISGTALMVMACLAKLHSLTGSKQ